MHLENENSTTEIIKLVTMRFRAKRLAIKQSANAFAKS